MKPNKLKLVHSTNTYLSVFRGKTLLLDCRYYKTRLYNLHYHQKVQLRTSKAILDLLAQHGFHT